VLAIFRVGNLRLYSYVRHIRQGILVAVAAMTVVLAGRAPGMANFAFMLLFLVRPLSTVLTRRLR
jgi:hypothetical protein